MTYDFDRAVDRRGTNCLKYDFARERGRSEELLPLWVADMDFETAPCVKQRLKKAVEHGIYGYSEGKAEYFDAVHSWYEKRFGWDVKTEWLIKTPGVVFALAACVRAFTQEGEAVLLQQPVYYPFSEVILDNGRRLVNSPLVLKGGRYEMDFEDLERKIIAEQVKLFLLCSPHNPVGRVWEEWELKKVGEICLRHGVLVVSDEIHSDFVWPGKRHRVFASLDPAFSRVAVTCTAPSKTFNLAGLQISNIFIENAMLRKKFLKAVAQAGYSQVGLFGLLACQAAYEEGQEWLEELDAYLYENLLFVRSYLQKHIPEVKLIEPEGTYLVWLDFRGLSLSGDELEALIVRKAKLWLDSGRMFGPDGEGFQRMNIACPRSVLQKALEQLDRAVRTNDMIPGNY